MSARARRALALLGLGAGAGAYFAFVSSYGIELIDEGQIIYPSWAVSEGAMPYRDFHHLYGPALFFVNGAVLRWLGADLMSLRAFLVVVKAIAGILIYVLARRVASRPFALLVWACFVVIWGTPLVFNGPYANHFASSFCLLGFVVYLSSRFRFPVRCMLTGLCFGAAATFKQTSGTFGLVSFFLFLLLDRRPAAEHADSDAARVPEWFARLVGLGVPLAAIAIFSAYVWTHLGSPRAVLLILPATTLALFALVRAATDREGAGKRPALGIVCAAAAAAVFPSCFAAIYAAEGALAEVFFDLIAGLPKVMRPFVLYPVPDIRTFLGLTGLAGLLGALWLGRIASATARSRGAALGLSAIAVAAIVLLVTTGGGPRFQVPARVWVLDVIRLWFLEPFVVLLFTGTILFGARRRGLAGDDGRSGTASKRTDAVRLLACNAAVSVIYLYPASDYWHVVMALPYFLPLIAYLLEHYVGDANDRARRWRPAALAGVAATCAIAIAPSVQILRDALVAASPIPIPRATGVRATQTQSANLANVVRILAEHHPPAGPLFVTSGEQLLYFLAGRRSALERDEFILYLVAMRHIANEDALRLVDEERTLARLAQARPLIVENDRGSGTKHFRQTFPRIGRYIDEHYRVAGRAGPYKVLKFNDSESRADDSARLPVRSAACGPDCRPRAPRTGSSS